MSFVGERSREKEKKGSLELGLQTVNYGTPRLIVSLLRYFMC